MGIGASESLMETMGLEGLECEVEVKEEVKEEKEKEEEKEEKEEVKLSVFDSEVIPENT